jgi:hypothetical protein
VAVGKNPYQILEDYKQRIEDVLRESLVKNDRYASGALAKSIDAKVKIFGQSISIQVFMFDYWKFINEGVNGTVVKHGSPYSFKKNNVNQAAMLDLIKKRGITEYKNKKGEVVFSTKLSTLRKKKIKSLKSKVVKKAYKQLSELQKRKTLAFLLGRGISKFGTKPTNFVDEGIQGIEKDLERDLLEAVGREIEVQLTVK